MANPVLSGASNSPASPALQGTSAVKAASPFTQNIEATAEKPTPNQLFQFVPNSSATQDTSAKNSTSGLQPIKLSAGVALPQTGPEGILMSFSVDYELQGAPGTTPYVWVIDRGQGVSAKRPVRLTKKQGNLIILIPGWRPTDGPFQTHLEDKTGKQLSASVELLGQN
jgi:hypothetical protein